MLLNYGLYTTEPGVRGGLARWERNAYLEIYCLKTLLWVELGRSGDIEVSTLRTK